MAECGGFRHRLYSPRCHARSDGGAVTHAGCHSADAVCVFSSCGLGGRPLCRRGCSRCPLPPPAPALSGASSTGAGASGTQSPFPVSGASSTAGGAVWVASGPEPSVPDVSSTAEGEGKGAGTGRPEGWGESRMGDGDGTGRGSSLPASGSAAARPAADAVVPFVHHSRPTRDASAADDPRCRACLDCGCLDMWQGMRPVVIHWAAGDPCPPSIRFRCAECLVTREGMTWQSAFQTIEQVHFPECVLASASLPLAFGKAFQDEWRPTSILSFTWYYIRAAGGTYPCNTATLSRAWDGQVATGPQGRQVTRWYCRLCGARYKTRFGVLCELRAPFGVRFYVKTTGPLANEECAKYAILDMLTSFPIRRDEACAPYLRPTDFDGTFRITNCCLDEIPQLQWPSLLAEHPS